ncbi:ATPase [Photobacterium leiognathi]|uniref:ATPase n=1 Tax=Photobacterium leiognathi TaxID=553611 RepID=UPI0029819F50|nr:ATPase [Photobacterium leiognathi]
MSGLFNAIRELSGNEANISISKVYIRFCDGYLNQAAVLSQLVFWSEKTTRKDGWFYKRHEELADELGFSVDQVRYAVKKLKIRLSDSLDTSIKKANGVPTTHYKFNNSNLMKLISNSLNSDSVTLPTGNGNITESIRGSHRNLGNGKTTESINRSNTDPIKQINNLMVPCEGTNEYSEIIARSESTLQKCKTTTVRTQRKLKTELVDDFNLTEPMLQWYSAQGFTLDVQTATCQWVDSMKARGSKYLDWEAAWRNGMRNANKWAINRTNKQILPLERMGSSVGNYGPPEGLL